MITVDRLLIAKLAS